MNTEEAKQLLKKYANGTASAEEKHLVESWYLNLKANQANDNLPEEMIDRNTDEVWRVLQVHLPKKSFLLWPRLAVAGVVAALIFSVGLLFFKSQQTPSKDTQLVQTKIIPGGNKATILIAGQEPISLDENQKSVAISTDGIKYQDGKAIVGQQAENIMLTALTPKGGTYNFILPDGSLAVLNADSKLIFPSSFAKHERRITLQGEGYFEVTKDSSRPFIVESGNQQVRVLGTHFNINAYKDEPNIKTTLLEGSVEIVAGSSHAVIKPGQQSSFKSGSIKVLEVNVNNVVDWKNGMFRFKNESLTSILRKVSRWYDVEIVYQTDATKMPTFSGAISRFDNVTAVLQMLAETSDVKFTIEGKTINVK